MNRIPVWAALGAAMPLVFDSAVKGFVLLATAGLLTLAMARASAATRHLVWLIAVVALLMVPVLSVCLPQWRVLPAWAATPVRMEQLAATPPILPASQAEGDAARVRIVEPQSSEPGAFAPDGMRESAPIVEASIPIPASKALRSSAKKPGWREWLPLLWMLGCGLCALRLAAAYVLLRHKAAACSEVSDGPLADALDRARTQLGVSQRVRLLLDAKRTIPVVWGIFRPRLVLPAEAEEWGTRQLRSVLLHELAHIRRRDIAVQLLTQVACALHWFNPLVWLAAWRLHVERERACDDLVLASGVRASDYAEHLLHVATSLQGARWTSACGLAMARPSSLEGRLLAVLSDRLNRRRVTAALAAVALLLGAAVAIPLAMLRAEEEPWVSPSGAHIGGTRSSFCIHDGTQAHFVLYYAGDFGSSSGSSSNARARTWTNTGTLTLANKKTVSFLRSHTAPETLTLNGEVYDLPRGRVFVIGEDAGLRQLPLNPPAIRTQEALDQLEKRVKTTLAALPAEGRVEHGAPAREQAKAAEALPALRTLLEGRWEGERDGTKVEILFTGDKTEEVVWRYHFNGPGKSGVIIARMLLVAEGDAQVLRYRYFSEKDRTRVPRHADMGRITRGADGAFLLEVTAAAAEVNPDYVPVQGLVLKQVEKNARTYPRSREARELFAKWKPMLRTDGKVPGALIGGLAKEVEQFIAMMKDRVALEKDEAARAKFVEILKRMDTTRDWPLADAAALLDEIAAISIAPLGWAEMKLTFSGMREVKPGKPLPGELKGAAWGPPSVNGLRSAWMLVPTQPAYPLGTVLKTRVLFHNTGDAPVVFSTETWHQYDGTVARDAKGNELPIKRTRFSGATPMATYRLAPGEYAEVQGHGIAIGAGEYLEESSLGSVGAIVEARENDEVSMEWMVDAETGGWTRPDEPKEPAAKRRAMFLERALREAPMPSTKPDREQTLRRVMLDLVGTAPTAVERTAFTNDEAPGALERLAERLLEKPEAQTFKGKLKTGVVKFSVVAADPEAAKRPRTASGPGRYLLAENVHLLVSRTSTDGGHANKATIVFLSPDPKLVSQFAPHAIALPDGLETYQFVWERESKALWLLERGSLRKFDFAAPDAVKEANIPEGSSALPMKLREAAKRSSDNH